MIALDGHLSGKSHREIATALYSADYVNRYWSQGN